MKKKEDRELPTSLEGDDNDDVQEPFRESRKGKGDNKSKKLRSKEGAPDSSKMSSKSRKSTIHSKKGAAGKGRGKSGISNNNGQGSNGDAQKFDFSDCDSFSNEWYDKWSCDLCKRLLHFFHVSLVMLLSICIF